MVPIWINLSCSCYLDQEKPKSTRQTWSPHMLLFYTPSHTKQWWRLIIHKGLRWGRKDILLLSSSLPREQSGHYKCRRWPARLPFKFEFGSSSAPGRRAGWRVKITASTKNTTINSMQCYKIQLADGSYFITGKSAQSSTKERMVRFGERAALCLGHKNV